MTKSLSPVEKQEEKRQENLPPSQNTLLSAVENSETPSNEHMLLLDFMKPVLCMICLSNLNLILIRFTSHIFLKPGESTEPCYEKNSNFPTLSMVKKNGSPQKRVLQQKQRQSRGTLHGAIWAKHTGFQRLGMK